MSNPGLPDGAFITSLNGRRCTAVPRSDAPVAAATPTVVAPPVVANVDNDDNGNDNDNDDNNDNDNDNDSGNNVGGFTTLTTANDADTGTAETQDTQDTPEIGALEDTGAAAASTAISIPPPGLDSSKPESSSQALPQDEDAIGQTRVQAQALPPPRASPSPIVPPPQALSQDSQPQDSPSPSPSTDPPQPSQPATESTQTDDSTAPTVQSEVANEAGDQRAPTPTLPADPQDSSDGDSNAGVANSDVATTTIGLDDLSAAGDSQPTPSSISSGEPAGRTGPATAVVAGSVAGGIAFVSIIAFLLWLWRKKSINKRRSSLLTPLTIAPGKNGSSGSAAAAAAAGAGSSEKTGYVIDRESLGPTTKGEKLRAAVGARFQRMWGGGGQHDSENLGHRGAPPFVSSAAASLHSRGGSSVFTFTSSPAAGGVPTSRDRFKDWWSRLTADVDFNWKLRNERGGGPDPSAAQDMRERNAAASGSQPDFLTLLGMDDGEVRREAEKRRADHANGGSAAGSGHFLGGLGLSFDSSAAAATAAGGIGPGPPGDNPFSDLNALSHDSAKPAPLAVGGGGANPFSDDNAIKGASGNNYVADVRRSRAGTIGSKGGAPPRAAVVDSLYRDSLQSEAAGSQRPKFRSDPFDLDRPELLGGAAIRQDLPILGGGLERPRRAHARVDSYSSKYSSGFSLGDWSDPGPDVGPAASRWDSPTEGHRPSRSAGEKESVGKAM